MEGRLEIWIRFFAGSRAYKAILVIGGAISDFI